MNEFRMQPDNGLEFGVYTLGDHLVDPTTGKRISAQQRLQEIVELAKLSDEAGLDFFSVGESHQQGFVTQAHTVVLSHIAAVTSKIKLGSSSTIISTLDPVRVYEDFATLDLLSNHRTEIIAGRASRIGLFELLGYDISDYEALFEEKFELLLKINQEERVNWSGEFRAPLTDAEVLPRAVLPIWRAVGGTSTSAIKAGRQGVPMQLATLGGAVSTFKHVIERYRNSLEEVGLDPLAYPVGTAGFFHVAETTQQAQQEMYPYINEGMKVTNGQGFPKQAFAQGKNKDNVMNIGSVDEVVEKILYQHDAFKHQRYLGQMDFGGVSFKQLMRTIDLIGEHVLPKIRQYTKK
ncbi:alkanesulfonate monooxygenase SsuD/methylene tetrahydromethanopterin reductase-like flavin-dependent oxidoreductase (luciferase family) [Streptohalobacillus salinus]|uniref:Alkanesulfonate monooxygenase SsuD/methylene tetrahydromethanopterin reductase-like flavin-dependent oxidoreductase (Luciferase family) n=1 Tax=Streptohalobacillus salinus TaxID=621096 RepID=A0A2V3W2I6_9BACI|nr:LLM class flavin-dependent oxidoreductase [Streptohalobacillus salinus]PXW86475.1 alkanesulfonate monooxygenase SsuD/methylene tetrahydromethanopterin reductase-like flavin-dependent oxidoreductase (luciferase family) [Streptohalobacillus salinus]